MNSLWKDWCWRWNSNTLVTWSEELTHWKRPWCWERLKAGGEGDDRGWDGWMHHWLNGHESEKTPGDSEGQGSLAHLAWGLRGHKESDTTEQLNNNNKPLGCERISFCCSKPPSVWCILYSSPKKLGTPSHVKSSEALTVPIHSLSPYNFRKGPQK